ncbi:MAG: endonuclease [Oscillospiraceae bacterium]|nr:endonuclease [Oscillospiraceae bacterium]
MLRFLLKLLKILLTLVLIAVLGVAGLFGYLTLTEYKPADVEWQTPLCEDDTAPVVEDGATLKILSWNIGYAGLGAGSDFYMDGGKDTASADNATVNKYLDGINTTIREGDYDLVLLQEVDVNSSRTYSIDESTALRRGTSYHALNHSCAFVPLPIPEPIGKVHAGLMTISDYKVEHAERHQLPCPFTWPVRTANLKRCLLVNYLPVEGTDKQLVLIDLHLEAYDSGEGKIAQTKQLMSLLEKEYEKGNYVIAGGDFNQIFPGSLDLYPNTHPELWLPGVLEEDSLPEGFRFAYDLAAPSCRLLNQPYDPSDTVNTQYYVIDGFILSPNVQLDEVKVLDEGFANSDHNPVSLQVTLLSAN